MPTAASSAASPVTSSGASASADLPARVLAYLHADALGPPNLGRRLGRCGGRAVVTVASLVARFAADGDDRVLDAIADLEADGRLETWEESPRGLAVVLAPLEAYRLGIELDDRSGRWRKKGGDRKPTKVRTTFIELAAARDTRDDCPVRKRMPHGFGAPWPTVLVGERLIWRGPDWIREKPCPGCGGRVLEEWAACLLCNASGSDLGMRRRRKKIEAEVVAARKCEGSPSPSRPSSPKPLAVLV